MAATGEEIFNEDCVEETIENGDNDHENEGQSEKTERLVRLPLSRVKNIMKTDPDVTLSSQDAVFLIAKATELFIQDLAKEVLVFTLSGKRKTVQRKDIDLAIDQNDSLAFLEVLHKKLWNDRLNDELCVILIQSKGPLRCWCFGLIVLRQDWGSDGVLFIRFGRLFNFFKVDSRR